MRAIPTEYRGTPFRSRLEADFAAHFDAVGIAWDYEPEGFELDNGMRYLPDFYLPQIRAWVEVKGNHMERVDKFEAFARQLWTEMEPDEHGEKSPLDSNSPMCILAQLGDTSTWGPERVGARRPTFIGAYESGSYYSIFMAPCRRCGQATFTVLGVTPCRICGKWTETSMEWFEAWLSGFSPDGPLAPLTRAPVKQWKPTR